MKYCSVNKNKEHLIKLLDWLYKEVMSACGDGDAVWYSKYYDVKEILELVREYNDKLQFKWIIEFNEDKKQILWWRYQESILITNDEEIYKNLPSWQQCIVVS